MLTAIKLKNRISKLVQASERPIVIEYTNLRNIKINGETRGCSGFIRNLDNGVIVYVDTEEVPILVGRLMYRYAKHNKDYSGCHNCWAKESNYCEEVYKALLDKTAYDNDVKRYTR